MLTKGLGLLDKTLLLSSLTGAIVVGAVLWREDLIIQSLLRQQNGDHKIGKIIETKNDTRRRRNQSLTWYPAFVRSDLFERDSLFTGPDSGIDLMVGESKSVHLDPNCLVVLQTINNETVFDLQLGSIQVKSLDRSPVKIISNGTLSVLTPSKGEAPLYVQKNPEGGLKVENEVIKEEKPLAQEIAKPVALAVAPTPSATPTPTPEPPKVQVALQAPVDRANLLQKPGEPVEFSWTLSNVQKNETPKLKLQIARSRNFESLVLDVAVVNQKYFWSGKTAEGIYYVRLVQADSLAPAIEAREFHLNFEKPPVKPVVPIKPVVKKSAPVKPPPPKPVATSAPTPAPVAEAPKPPPPAVVVATPDLLSPADKTTLVNFGQKEISPTLFAWKKTEMADSYEIQFAEDDSFQQVLLSQKLAANQFVLKKLLSKKAVLWRVRALQKEASSGWSKPRSFEMQTSE